MKTILVLALAIGLFSFSIKDILTGRWESKPSAKGNVTGIFFKSDNSFEGYVNKKPFVSGRYTLQENTFSFTDNGCAGKEGVYEIVFFSNGDSMRFTPIRDSCNERREGMSRLVLGKVKSY